MAEWLIPIPPWPKPAGCAVTEHYGIVLFVLLLFRQDYDSLYTKTQIKL